MEQALVFHAPLLRSRGQCAGGCFSRYRLTRTHTAATAVSTPTITSPAPSSSKPGGAHDETSHEPTRSKQNTDRTGADGGCPTLRAAGLSAGRRVRPLTAIPILTLRTPDGSGYQRGPGTREVIAVMLRRPWLLPSAILPVAGSTLTYTLAIDGIALSPYGPGDYVALGQPPAGRPRVGRRSARRAGGRRGRRALRLAIGRLVMLTSSDMG